MATDTILSNAYPVEGTATTTETQVTWPWKSRRVMITNDDGAINILYRFKQSLPQATLQAGEVVTLDMRKYGIFLQAASGTPAYRVQVLG